MSRPSPAAELELVPLLAGCEARRAELLSAARSLLSRVDFDALAGALADRRLLPLIGSRAVEAGGDTVPERFRSAVVSARAIARAHGLAVEGATRRVVAMLEAGGIRALPLKGPLLAADVHGDIGLRATHDIDLLVSRDQLEAGVRRLVGAGFAQPGDPIRADGLPDLHFHLKHPSLPSVELHWRAHWDEHAFSERMLARAEPGPDGLLRAQPDDLAASLLLYYARDGFHGVRMAADIGAWWDTRGHELPEGFLEGHAVTYPELAPTLTAAALAAERIAGVPALGWLGEGAAPSRRVRLAARFADWAQQRDRDQLSANRSLVGGLLGPPGAVPAFARRELSLPQGTPAQNVAHAAKLLARFALALWELRGGRAWVEPPVSACAR